MVYIINILTFVSYTLFPIPNKRIFFGSLAFRWGLQCLKCGTSLRSSIFHFDMLDTKSLPMDTMDKL